MNAKETIRKIVFVAIWVAIGGGMLTLLIAAIGRQKRDHCKDYIIRIKGTQKDLSAVCCAFVDDNAILKLLESSANGKIKGQKKSSFNLLTIEQRLENNPWIKDAELYFDNRDVLHISVTEREPVARIFTVTGKSFYIDGEEKRMPLSDKLSARVPVFTGFPEKVISKRDMALLHDVRMTAGFILHDPFWMSQVAQIDVTAEREFEMIPVVGNHTVLLGNGENIAQKFHRLFVFYKNVLSQTGFEKYKAINVQYAGQVIGIKNISGAKSDTAQLRRNVEKLLRQARELQNDSLVAARELKEQKLILADPAISATEKNITNENTDGHEESNPDPVLVTNPVSMKRFVNPKPGEKPKNEPKAVMKKKGEW